MTTDSPTKIFVRLASAKRQNLASWIGTLGLVGITFGLGASTAAYNVGIILLLLGSILVLDDIIRTITIDNWLLVAMLTAFLLLTTLWTTYQLQVDVDKAWKEFRSLAKIAGLPSLAAGWWLLRGHLRYHHLLALLTLGILIGCFDGLDIERAVHSPFAGKNIISDINSNELGFLAGILFTVSSISLLLDQRSKSSLPGSNALWNSLFIVTAIVSGYLVITSQSKAVILGTGIAIASVFFLRNLITRFNYNRQGHKNTVIAVSTLAIFCVITFTPIGQVLIKRFDGLGETLLMLANGDIEVMSGLELILKDRLEMWRESVSLIADAPLIGHGPGTAPALLAKSSYSEIAHYQHFHSLWLHLLVIIGIVGTLGFAALFLSLSITSAKGAINHDKYISWLSLGLWVYFLVIIVAQLRINHPSGEAFVILVGGMSYYCGFSTLQNTSKR